MSETLLHKTKIGKEISKVTNLAGSKEGEINKDYFQDKAIGEVAANLLATWMKLVPNRKKTPKAEPVQETKHALPYMKPLKEKMKMAAAKGDKGKFINKIAETIIL